MSTGPVGFRSGFASLVGRPNAGKSTLTNALVGSKVAITSSRPQTTRHAIRGIVHRPDAQLVLIDTPGLHKPRTLLGERLNDLVRSTWAEVDVVVVCLPADEKIGSGDRFLVTELAKVRGTPKIAIATKSDLVSPDAMASHLMSISGLVPRQGRMGRDRPGVRGRREPGVAAGGPARGTAARRTRLLPGGRADRRARGHAGGRADPRGGPGGSPRRAAALDRGRGRGDGTASRAGPATGRCWTSTPTFSSSGQPEGDRHRARVARLKQVGSAARQQIEALLGTPVYLDLHVKVVKNWQRDPKQLRRLGF